MSLISWKPEFAIGDESVDFEHQQMISLINEIYDEMKTRRDADSIEQFMGDVHFAISAHFALEERLMRDAGYPRSGQRFRLASGQPVRLVRKSFRNIRRQTARTAAQFARSLNCCVIWIGAN
jgi:hemerythrin-like metal-binding protein